MTELLPRSSVLVSIGSTRQVNARFFNFDVHGAQVVSFE